MDRGHLTILCPGFGHVPHCAGPLMWELNCPSLDPGLPSAHASADKPPCGRYLGVAFGALNKLKPAHLAAIILPEPSLCHLFLSLHSAVLVCAFPLLGRPFRFTPAETARSHQDLAPCFFPVFLGIHVRPWLPFLAFV